jgi:hypothetical protein
MIECCTILYNALFGEKKSRLEINSTSYERRNLIPQQTKIEIPVIKRNVPSEAKVFTFEKTTTYDDFDDENEYDIV